MEVQQESFKRYEKKYIVDKATYQKMLPTLQEKMKRDQYGRHTICNLYFDTPDYELIRTSVSKPVYKEKLRLRSYGVPKWDDVVFIEIKKKFDGIVYKRRIPVALKEAVRYLYEGKRPKESGQIGMEIDWMLRRYNLEPVVFIAYDRVAMYGRDDMDLRVTFDANVRFRTDGLDLGKGSYGTRLLDSEKVLMEVKVPESVPLWMSRLFSEWKVYPTAFSKYGACYENHLIKKKYGKGGINCA